MDEATLRQVQVLREVAEGVANYGRPPSIPELMARLEVTSPNGIAKHLKALEKKGFIVREKGARGIRLTDRAHALLGNSQSHAESCAETLNDLVRVPLLGRIAAGSPLLAEEHIEDALPVPSSMTNATDDVFFLRVKGDSMIEEGILDGDLVLVRKSDTARNGEIAAVLVEDEATVKRVRFDEGRIVLQPANEAYEPIVVDPSTTQCRIMGVVTGLLRSYRTKL